MSAIDDGGPAFPKPLDPYPNMQSAERGWHGMTLRDWFAGQAAASIAHTILSANTGALQRAADAEGYAGPVDGYVAFRSYRIADAMLAARKEGK